MNKLKTYLQGGDLRSIAKANTLVALVKTQKDFDALFQCLFTKDRLIVMRSADAIEKITRQKPLYLTTYHQDIIHLMNTAIDKELKWHLALIVSRLNLTVEERDTVWNTLANWAKNKTESKIVRVNSIQSLFDLADQDEVLKKQFNLIIRAIEVENIPSITTRLKRLNQAQPQHTNF
ncbi:MAG: hypothetical protein CSA47_01295 [Gammaproteobacteria bacterium]|nr:MAG: hypothetical protein CSA47_01295 [Gammaproteobacteria bacterium]